MTTVTTIVGDAFRESNLIAISASPTANETTEALRLFNRYIRWLTARHKLINLNLGAVGVDTPSISYDSTVDVANRYVPENTRLMFNIGSPQTINLHPNPQDGAKVAVVDGQSNFGTYNVTVNGNGRTIETTQSVTLSTNGLNREWFYRADTGNWSKITDLVGADASPFPEEFDDLLIIGLAMRLNPRHGVAVDPQSIQTYKDTLNNFRSRYFQNRSVATEDALLRLPSNAYWANAYGSNQDFDRGAQ